MFVTNWISTTKIQKISEITNFFRHYFLSRTEVYFSLQKKCQVRNNGSQSASAGKYLTSLISLYTLWRLCPSFDLPKQFRSSCFPKLPASSTSFNTNFPYFSFGGTIRREAGMPNTSCMIYMIAPANFHNPNFFNSFCKTPRRSQPAQPGEGFDAPSTL